MLPSSGNNGEEYLENRFGVDSSELSLKQVNGDFWITSSEQSNLDFETEGIRAIRVMDIGLKPTTYLLQLLDEKICKNIAEVEREELEALAKEDGLIERKMSEKGYVALKFRGRVIGCGFYMDELISSRIPEGRMQELVDSI